MIYATLWKLICIVLCTFKSLISAYLDFSCSLKTLTSLLVWFVLPVILALASSSWALTDFALDDYAKAIQIDEISRKNRAH